MPVYMSKAWVHPSYTDNRFDRPRSQQKKATNLACLFLDMVTCGSPLTARSLLVVILIPRLLESSFQPSSLLASIMLETQVSLQPALLLVNRHPALPPVILQICEPAIGLASFLFLPSFIEQFEEPS